MRRIFILISLVLTTAYAMAQDKNSTIPIAALADRLKAQAKPVLILISTDWCRYCKMQKIQLEKNPDFQAAKNNFYFVEFDAETKDSILFNKKAYHYKSSGASTGIHELAIALGNGKEGISFPTWVLLNADYQVLFRYNGMLNKEQMQSLLDAIGI